MGFCELSSDDPALVISTYILALLPWSILTLWDPITEHWKPYWLVFFKSVLYLIISVAPYTVLIPYAVLQGCSAEQDFKELLTSVVAMIASLWNVRRALRGLLALYDAFLIWRDVDLELIYFAFRHLMPEARDANNNILDKKVFRRKCTVWNVLLSSVLVDNDFPGDAPRVKYVRSCVGTMHGFSVLPYGQGLRVMFGNKISYINLNFFKHLYINVYAADREARRSIIAVWVLWMVRRSLAIPMSFDPSIRVFKYPRAHRKLEKSHSEQYFGEGDLSSKVDHFLWKFLVSRENEKLSLGAGMEQMTTSSDSSITETENEESCLQWNPFEAALFRVAAIWRRRKDRRRELSVVSKREIEQQLTTLPTEITDDLSIVRACQIAELEMHLPTWGRKLKPPIEKLCSVLWLPSTYISALSTWIEDSTTVSTWATEAIKARQGILSSGLGKLLAVLVVLIFLELRKETFALEPTTNFVSLEELLLKNKEEAKDSEALIGRVGSIVGAIHKYFQAPRIIDILTDVEQRDSFLYDEVKCFLKGIFGETWRTILSKGHLDIVLRTSLDSLMETLAKTEMPKVEDDDPIPKLMYCLKPSYIYFCYMSRGIQGQSQNEWSRQKAENALYSHREHWTRGAGGEMSLEYKEMSSTLTVSFPNIPKGLYSVTISFRFNNLFQHASVWEEVLDPLHSIKVSIFVESPVQDKSTFRKDFEIEPIFLKVDDFIGLISDSPETEWIRLNCYNVFAAHGKSKIVVKMKFAGPITHFVRSWITIGSFQLLAMTEDDLNIKATSQLRSARQCAVRLEHTEKVLDVGYGVNENNKGHTQSFVSINGGKY